MPLPSDSSAAHQLESVQAELQALQKENSDLRAAGPTEQNSATNDGVISTTVEEQIAARRAELDAAFDVRVKAAEDQYQKRAESMKKQLSSKLGDAREKLRQENEEAIQKIQSDHAAEIERLKTEHTAEIARLQAATSAPPQQQQEANVKVEASSTAEPSTLESSATELTTANETQTEAKTEASKPLAELSDQEIREFIAKNPVAKSILVRNVQQRISKEREELVEKMKVDQSKVIEEKVEEARKKAEVAKENAVAMEGKKHSVKLNMSENRLRSATAKLDFIEAAARDTPQKPVNEVWAIAKDTKPAPLQPTAAVGASAASRPVVGQQAVQPGAFGQTPHPVATPVALQGQSVQQATFGQPSGTGNAVPVQQFGQPSGAGMIPNTNIPNVRPGGFGAPSAVPNPFGGVAQGQTQPLAPQQQGVPQLQLQTQPPAANAANRPANQPNAGTGPAALRNIIGTGAPTGIPRAGAIPRPNSRAQGPAQSGIPQPQGQNIQIQGAGRAQQQHGQQGQANQGQRNAGAGRGAGRGRGQGAAGGPASPSMNPAAKQFVPGGAAGGNKRPRDDENDAPAGRGGGGGPGKRARGGQGGGNNQ